MNQEKKIKYHEQNVEKLYEAVKTGTAPFLPNEKNSKAVNNVIILTPRPVVRSAASGKVFKGLNQLVAQVELDKMSRKDASVITYEQAQKQYELTQEEELALQALKQEILQGEDRSSCFILGAIFAFFMFFEIGIYRLMDGSIFKHPYLI